MENKFEKLSFFFGSIVEKEIKQWQKNIKNNMS